jgi:hypothetical protein
MIHAFCLKVLHRLPGEVDVPLSAFQESVIAWNIIQERAERKAEH